MNLVLLNVNNWLKMFLMYVQISFLLLSLLSETIISGVNNTSFVFTFNPLRMNSYFVLTLFVILFEIKCCQSKENFIPLAISELVKNYYVKNSMRFDFIADFESCSFELWDQLEETIKLSSTAIGVIHRSMKTQFDEDLEDPEDDFLIKHLPDYKLFIWHHSHL